MNWRVALLIFELARKSESSPHWNLSGIECFGARLYHQFFFGSRRLYGMYCRAYQALRSKSKVIQIGHELMEVVRFVCKFSIFLLVEGFQLTTALRRSSRIKTGVWMNYLEHQALRSKSKSSKSVKNSLSCWGFPVYFRFFADFEDFNGPALQEGGVCSWSLYGMHYEGHRALEFRRHRFWFAQEVMEIFRFFISILLILLIFLISTGQRFRKERSVHDNCMGSI